MTACNQEIEFPIKNCRFSRICSLVSLVLSAAIDSYAFRLSSAFQFVLYGTTHGSGPLVAVVGVDRFDLSHQNAIGMDNRRLRR